MSQVKVTDWLDQKETENGDISQLKIPAEMFYDEEPDETIFYEEINPCGFFCTENHPFSKVERYGRWYYCKGQDKKAGIHSSKMKWTFLTKDRALALQTAKAHIE